MGLGDHQIHRGERRPQDEICHVQERGGGFDRNPREARGYLRDGHGTPAFQAAREGKLNLIVNLGAMWSRIFQRQERERAGISLCLIVYYALPCGRNPSPSVKSWRAPSEGHAGPEVKEKMATMGLTPKFVTGKEYYKIVSEAVIRSPSPEIQPGGSINSLATERRTGILNDGMMKNAKLE